MIDRRPPLKSDLDCGVCIVGTGYTGMWSAYFLSAADPSLDIHLLEADYAGSGESGHNDGFVTGTIGGQSWSNIARRYGTEAAKGVHNAAARSVQAIYRFSEDHQMPIDVAPLGYYLVATSKRQDKQLRDDHALSAKLQPVAKFPPLLGTDAIRERIASPAIRSGVWRAGMLINPHKLAVALSQAVEQGGATIHEQTPVTSLRDDGRKVVLETPSATVRASRVILATNAWQSQFPQFAGRIMTQWHYALVTAPLPGADIGALNWQGREGFIEIRRPGIFGRLTADNRILFGGGAIWDAHDVTCSYTERETKHIERYLRTNLLRYFPMLDHVPVTHFYGGAMGVSPDRMPHIGWLSPRIAYAYGYSGNGISVSHVTGQLIRNLFTGKDVPDWAAVFMRADAKRFTSWPLIAFKGKSRAYISRTLGV